MTRTVAALYVTVLLAAAVSGCRSGGAHPSASSTSINSALTDQQLLAIARQYSQCLREHGLTRFPDPTLSDGRLRYDPAHDPKADMDANPAAVAACKSIADRLRAPTKKDKQYTGAEKLKLVEYARCIREHGVPEWPDPDSDGAFTLTVALEQENPETRIIPAQKACQRYWSGEIVQRSSIGRTTGGGR
jgi:hypothetical protein